MRANGQGGPVLTFCGDSDAHIVRGLIAILFATFSGKHAREILSTMPSRCSNGCLREHPTPQRSNGFRSMVERIRADARAAMATARRPSESVPSFAPPFAGRTFCRDAEPGSALVCHLYGFDRTPQRNERGC